jgi:RNA polymerase sigma-70 factor, ECF subfamily
MSKASPNSQPTMRLSGNDLAPSQDHKTSENHPTHESLHESQHNSHRHQDHNQLQNQELDESLVVKLAQGDAVAGEELIDRYHQPLLRFLSRLMGSATLAEELAQQTWLSVVEHASQFKPAQFGENGTSFRAWMYRIATNKVNDHWRSRGRTKKAYEGFAQVRHQTDHDIAPSAQDRLSDTEDQIRVRQAIDQLPDAQKQIVLLRYYSDMKFVEIAQMLGCPLNTALGRMHKAVQKLKGILQ